MLYVSVQKVALRYLVLPADKCEAPYLSHSVLSAFSVFDPLSAPLSYRVCQRHRGELDTYKTKLSLSVRSLIALQSVAQATGDDPLFSVGLPVICCGDS